MLSHYRKELPYSFETVSLDRAVGLVNTVNWNKRDLDIVYKGENGIKNKVQMRGHKNEKLVSGLKNGVKYEFTVSRHDLIGKLKYKAKTIYNKPRSGGSKYIVLVGASVGRHWQFSELSKRLRNDRYSFGYRGKGSFDKGDVVGDLINSQIRPDAIIIKECAAYFPKDIEDSKQKIAKWTEMISGEGITPILATCVPVNQTNDTKHDGRQKGILEYNCFIRQYAKRENILILDLEKALRNDSSNSYYLKEKYARADGLHLRKEAYSDALDPIVIPMLNKALK